MKAFCFGLVILLCSFSNAFADREMSQVPYVTTALGGRTFFLMKSDPNHIWDRDKGTGICYEVTNNGEFKELWRTEGWYSFKTYLAILADRDDGPIREHQYLVRLGNWPRGHKPEADHVGVAFYKDGILIKMYSTVDLIRDMSAIHQSTSHYEFLDNKYEPILEYQLQKNIVIFKLVTIDGVHYQFDVKTGQINEPAPDKNK